MKKLILTLALLMPITAFALPELVKTEFPAIQEVGSGKYKVLFIKVYRISLHQIKENPDVQALHIKYNVSLKAKKRLTRAMQDLRAQEIKDAPYEKWEAAQKAIYPDVKDGDTITILKTKENSTKFFHNEEFRGEIKDSVYTKAFFNIWLGEKTGLTSIKRNLLENAFHRNH